MVVPEQTPCLRSARVLLRPFEPSDVDGRVRCGRHPEIVRMFGAFGILGLHRIDLRVLAYHTRAISCYRRCGFDEEGRERGAAFIDGRWHDDVIMGILEHELPDP